MFCLYKPLNFQEVYNGLSDIFGIILINGIPLWTGIGEYRYSAGNPSRQLTSNAFRGKSAQILMEKTSKILMEKSVEKPAKINWKT